MSEIATAIKTLQQVGHIRDRMRLQNFLNSMKEEVNDSDKEIIDDIIARFDPERFAESDEEVIDIPQVKLSEAISALITLRLYEEQQQEGNPTLNRMLRQHEFELKGRQQAELRQDDLVGWLGGDLGGSK